MAWTPLYTKVSGEPMTVEDWNELKGDVDYLKTQSEVLVDAGSTDPNENVTWGNLIFWALRNSDV